MTNRPYTDLALEIQEACTGDNGEIQGVSLEKECEKACINVTNIRVLTDEGAESIGKPIGTYLTLEISDIKTCSGEQVDVISQKIKMLMPPKIDSVLIIGLGNAMMTADSLGPRTIEKLSEYDIFSKAAMLVPGVYAQTGMESSEIVKGIIQIKKPDCIITIDSLAARSAFRLGRTVQVTDTGIRPGSGVGNTRKEISKKTMNTPVIAIGIPTVVSAASIVSDAMETMKSAGYDENVLGSVALLGQDEYYELISEMIRPLIGNLFVMSRNLDEELEYMGCILSKAIYTAVKSN